MNKTIRFLLCALAIIIGSAGSRALGAEEVDNLADLKYSEATTWNEGNQTLTLNDDFIATNMIEIEETLSLDLNGHSITTSNVRCFSIKDGNTLTIVDNSRGSTKGSVKCTNEDECSAIYINSGCEFIATGITITATNGYAVNNGEGKATLTGCTLSSSRGLFNMGEATVTGCTISGNDIAIENEDGTLSINMGENPPACTISGEFYGISNFDNGTVAIGSGVSINSCSWAGIINYGGTVTLNAWPAFGTGDDKNGRDIWLFKGEKIAIGDGITAALAAPITVGVTDLDGNDLDATDLPYTITTGYAAHVKDAQSAVIDPASVFAYYTDTPGYTIALGGSNDSEAVLTGDPSDPPIGFDVTDLLAPTYTEGTDAEWTFTMPDYNVKAEVEYVDAAFSITRNAGQTDETVSYFATLAEAVAAAASGEWIVQLADYETADMVTIDKGLYLNLNGHTYTSTNSTAAIKVAEGYALNLSCYNGGTDINGTLRNNSNTGGKGIIVEAYGSLQTNYVSIASASDYAIYNEGYTDLNNSSINGQSAIYIDGYFSVNHTAITAADYGIYGAGGDYVLNAGVSISGCSKAGIYCNGSKIYISAQPTFGTGDDAKGTDIWIANGTHIEFGSNFTYTPAPKITVRVTESDGTALETTDLPLTITDGYADYFTDESGVIDPNTVFAWYDATEPVAFALDNGEAKLVRLLLLSDDADNTSRLASGLETDVRLAGRTLYKDGAWNTLCLPFAVSDGDATDALTFSGTPLAGAVVKELVAAKTSLNNEGELTIKFSEPVTSIEAGKPYIVKWAADGSDDIIEPTFTDVTISSTTPTPVEFEGGKFVGQFSPFHIVSKTEDLADNEGNVNEILFIGGVDAQGKTLLGYSDGPRTLRSCRAHFYVPATTTDSGNARAVVRSVNIDFGDGAETTGIQTMSDVRSKMSDEWYSLDGRRLSGKPAAKGLYIHNGKKVVIK